MQKAAETKSSISILDSGILLVAEYRTVGRRKTILISCRTCLGTLRESQSMCAADAAADVSGTRC